MYHLPGLCLHSMYDVGYMFVCMAVRVCLCAWVGSEGQTLIAKADAVLEKVGIPLAPGQCDSATKAMRQQVSGSMCVLSCVYIHSTVPYHMLPNSGLAPSSPAPAHIDLPLSTSRLGHRREIGVPKAGEC